MGTSNPKCRCGRTTNKLFIKRHDGFERVGYYCKHCKKILKEKKQ